MNQSKLHSIIAKHRPFAPTLDGFIDFTNYLESSGSDFLADGYEQTGEDYNAIAEIRKELHTTLE
jgi:hypothetical protein